MKFIITWEVSWFDSDWNEKKRYTETEEYFDEHDGIKSIDDFLNKFDDMFMEDRFSPENNVNEYIEEGGDLNIEYMKICNLDGEELWRDPEYKEE